MMMKGEISGCEFLLAASADGGWRTERTVSEFLRYSLKGHDSTQCAGDGWVW
jgi:hypothetical protein